MAPANPPPPRTSRRRPARAVALLVAPVLLGAALASCAVETASTPLDARIAFHERKLRDDPGLYPVRAELGEALLERARITHDPRDVRRAREELERSIELQPNFHAFKAMTALCNFSHRFEEALAWADRAEAAYPEDTGVTAQRIEALLGLGRIDDAAAALQRRGAGEGDFYLTAAEGRLRSARGDVDGAAASFARAAEIAKAQRASSLTLWANVSAAAAFIDSGRAEEGAPYLDAAAAIDPSDPLMLVHHAEVLVARGQVAEAITVYDSLLEQLHDPVLHASAYGLHDQLGNTRAARRHFRAAEAGFRRAIDAGEVYTLDALARLYLDADTKLEEARTLAQRNLEFKQDGAAREVLQRIEARLDEQR